MSITTQRIRQLADEQGRKLSFICEKIGMKGRTYFTDIDTHNREIPQDKLIKIAEILNTTIDYLLGQTDNPLPNTVKLSLTTHETNVINAYRSHPEMQPAVDKILGIDSPSAGNIAADVAEEAKDFITSQQITSTKQN